MDKELETEKYKYLDLTHKLNDYNEIYNVNSYLKGANSAELQRLLAVNDTLRTRILRLKQEYMLHDHDISEYNFRLGVLYFSAVVVCFVLFIAALFAEDKIPRKLAFVGSIGLFTLYLIIVLIVVKVNSNRRKYSYNQWYWKPMEKKK